MSNDFLQLRHEYRSCLKLAAETDSKKEDVLLREEAASLLKKLREICPHEEVVCLCSEYDGSYTDDYSDKNPEDRICLCCGINESAYGIKFLTLIKAPIARFTGGRYSDKLPAEMKNPLDFLLSEVKEFAIEKGYHYFGSVSLR